ncbi:MAG: DNA (cytosine-5-)-methyltransferase [Flavobacteriaceae bacterium TMED68]|nr:MAG: DNA (cytosine-5-)-methyltransferase [Flavobacteriaceae bacterium TMED68]|tara:strand:- start:498 stop:1724 length:1227 start_codon:yes stop_codon:yes gene_type:complete
MTGKKLKVVELFAGVGGFRLGLEKLNKYEVIWSNQWEPQTKTQHASLIYEHRFGHDGHSSEDIETVPTNEIPQHDLLCGGFPCQDYSVATTLKNSKGLIGKKGVLWWSIHRILNEIKDKPTFLFLENVDRLLKSPSSQRGRDFAVMLQSLNDLGYSVEWRVVNAADYGMPQRRRRVFFLGYKKDSKVYKQLKKSTPIDWLLKDGVIQNTFKAEQDSEVSEFVLDDDLVDISNNFNVGGKKSLFENTGMMIDGEVTTLKTFPVYKGKSTPLKSILEKNKVDEEFFIPKSELPQWKYLKGAKSEERVSSDGYVYKYAEGSMVFPDDLDQPSRTIITSEGGKSPSRFRHAIQTKDGLRRLTPLELERLNMFPDNHTQFEGVTNSKRGFLMGNALVVGVVEKIGETLYRFNQ